MFSYTSRFALSQSGSTAKSSFISFGTDQSQDPAFLDGELKDSPSFAAAMLVLGGIVRTDMNGEKPDRSAYQAWVNDEYLKDLSDEMVHAQRKLPELLRKKSELASAVETRALKVAELRKNFGVKKRRYYDWLYATNRQMWLVLDPIVSVQKDATFFEAFSKDESVYARVTLPHTALSSKSKPVLGTTNIDFSVPLEREFHRARNFRPLTLTVGQKKVALSTESSGIVEKKIDLPESWVRGLVEVQASLPLARHHLEISPLLLAAVLAQLESKKERRGPRAMRIVARPGEVVTAILEPWAISLPLSLEPWEGHEEIDIKVWGRRRLIALAALLPKANSAIVSLIDDGMPSFWTLQVGDIELTVALSGWTSQDWASKARFSAMSPTSAVTEDETAAALSALIALGSASPQTLAEELGATEAAASTYLNKLSKIGAAMYERRSGQYLHRQLFPQIDLGLGDEAGREERLGVELNSASAVQISSTLELGKATEYRAIVSVDKENYSVLIAKDEDLRVTYAQCNCPHFNFNKLKLGPCRHIVATSLAVDSN